MPPVAPAPAAPTPLPSPLEVSWPLAAQQPRHAWRTMRKGAPPLQAPPSQQGGQQQPQQGGGQPQQQQQQQQGGWGEGGHEGGAADHEVGQPRVMLRLSEAHVRSLLRWEYERVLSLRLPS